MRAEQIVVVNELDRAQAPQTDASRSLVEFVSANTDVSHELARDLVLASRTIANHRPINFRLAREQATFDRTMDTLRYAESGATPSEVEASYARDLGSVRRMTAAARRVDRRSERAIHASRFFTAQPTLDRSRFRFWGELPGVDGHVVEKAIVERSDEFRLDHPDVPNTRGQRQADALVAMSLDSLDRVEDGDASSAETATGAAPGGHVTVFVDAERQDAAETGTEVAYGPRVGPDTLERLLCTGTVRVVGMAHGKPVTATAATRAIPPATRDAVVHRDGGCTIDGCTSRYRLQPHHITPFSEGGSHDSDNLATLCWYHHHVAIHQAGYRLDPSTLPHRRRLIRPRGRDPGRPPAHSTP